MLANKWALWHILSQAYNPYTILLMISSFINIILFELNIESSFFSHETLQRKFMIYWFVVDLWVSTPWHFPLASIFLFALMQMTIGLRPSNLKVIHKRFQISASSNDFPRHDVAKTSVARFDISFQAKSISWLSVNLRWQLLWSKLLQLLFLHILK